MTEASFRVGGAQRSSPARPSDRAAPRTTTVASRLPAGWRRFLPIAFTCGGAAMIPWLGVLGYVLPQAAIAAHWNVAWIGLDALEAFGLLATGRLIARGDRRYAVTATLTGTALLVDAWFDVLTSTSRSELLVAAVMAGAVELPLCCLCYFLAWRAIPRAGGGQQ